jgi:hypothetical protein
MSGDGGAVCSAPSLNMTVLASTSLATTLEGVVKQNGTRYTNPGLANVRVTLNATQGALARAAVAALNDTAAEVH